MNFPHIKYPDVVQLGILSLDITKLCLEINQHLNIIKTSIEDFYSLINFRKGVIVVSNNQSISCFLELIENSQHLSEKYLKTLILFCNSFENLLSISNSLSKTKIFIVLEFPEIKDQIKFFNSVFNIVLDLHTKTHLEQYADLLALKIQEKEIVKSIEYKTLDQKFQKEIKIRQELEKEFSNLKLSLRDYTLKSNDLIKELKNFNYEISDELKVPL